MSPPNDTPVQVEALYRQYGPVIYARCRRLLRNAQHAEDATQDVFVKVLTHLPKVPAAEHRLQWLYRMTTNHCLNVLRDDGRHQTDTEEAPPATDFGAEARLLARDLARRTFSSVSERVRATAALHYGEGFNQQQVADDLGVSRRTVLYRLSQLAVRANELRDAAM